MSKHFDCVCTEEMLSHKVLDVILCMSSENMNLSESHWFSCNASLAC